MYGKRELRSEKSEEAELWDERKKSLPGFNKDVIIFRHGLFSIALVAVCVCVCASICLRRRLFTIVVGALLVSTS